MKKLCSVFLILLVVISCNTDKNDFEASNDLAPKKATYHPHTIEGLSDPLVVNPTPLKAVDHMYIDECMQLLAYGLVDVINDPNYWTLIKSEVDKRFDGDENALFRDISTTFSNKGHDLNNLMKNSVTNHAPAVIRSAKDRLDDILNKIEVGDDVLYPQIYIPFFDQNKGQASVKNIGFLQAHDSISGDSIIDNLEIISTSPTQIQFGDLMEFKADDDLSIIISINESVDLSGELRVIAHYDGSRSGRDHCGDHKWIEFYPTMTIRNADKESWVNGSLEIEGMFFQAEKCDVTWHYSRPLKKLDREDAKYSKAFDIHHEWSNNWTSCEEQMAMVYEYDKWPSNWRPWDMPTTHCSSLTKQYYNSADGLYIQQEYFFNTYVNDPSIPWEGTYTLKTNPDTHIWVRGRWE